MMSKSNIRAADRVKTIPKLAGILSDLVHGEGAIVDRKDP